MICEPLFFLFWGAFLGGALVYAVCVPMKWIRNESGDCVINPRWRGFQNRMIDEHERPIH